MKTEEEIKEELQKARRDIETENNYMAVETYGYILALKWVLESEEE